MKTFFKGTLFVLVLVIGLTGIAIYWTFYRPLPDYNSTTSLSGLNREVKIHWDTFGVPHIYATNKLDLYRAAGYVHAQDRLWQMTLSQLAAEGRFSEFFGKELLPYDRLQRTIGFWRVAKEMEQQLSDSTRSLIQAYADGVNAYVENHPKSLPIQFALADMEPIPWKVTHTLALSRLMAWDLNIPWKAEISYSLAHQRLSDNQFRQLFPNEKLYAANRQTDTASSSYAGMLIPLLKKQQELDKLLNKEGSLKGSNAWAVDGSKSDTGYPLLAGDPHLGLNMPGNWYEIHYNLNGKNLSGATLAGAPVIILGQNDSLAWSLTNIMLDDTDFFEEAINPLNSNQYVLDTLAGETLYEEFTVQREVIKIKNDDDTTFTRRVSKHGPVISDIYHDQELIEDRVITMQWTGLDVTNEMEALDKMGWAQSFDEFQEAITSFRVPGQNIIYADKAGNIAQFAAANVPIRNPNPVLIRDGWDPDQDWQGFVPFNRLPRSINPEQGWVANANNAIVNGDYPNYVTAYWHGDYRYQRIRQYLNRSGTANKQLFQLMQNDTYSALAEEVTGYILPVLESYETQNEYFEPAISYLRNWDFTYSPSETAASIMDVFILEFTRNVLEDELGSEVYDTFINYSGQPVRVITRLMRDGSSLFDNVNTEQEETMQMQIISGMEDALDYLVMNRGPEPIEWRWEQIHTLTLKAPLFGEAAEEESAPVALKLIVDNILNKGPFPAGGHSYSINNGEYRWTNPYNMVLGPSIRRIVDFSDLSSTLSILPTGQSGNPLSQYYGDQTESWLNGEYKFFYQDSSFFNESQYRTTRLMPEN
ncbi:MAG: penicillin acylase family protein [Balneolaceae bacterium]|nr:penicillin acylase family protein [Balneolaceae bacterium]